jgi:hypothetical protein
MALDHQASRDVFDQYCRWPPMSSPCPLEDRAGYGCGFLEADELLRDLELARDALDDRGAIGPLAGVETQVIRLHRKLGFDEGGLL